MCIRDRLYTDLSFITTRQEIGEEASAVFNNMALQRLTSEADTMLVAPLRFKSVLLEEMDRQIALAMQGKPASIILKNNSINDPQIIAKISEASCAGVRVDMIVRGICCVRAGVPGCTENVHIRSLVGRYLEHSRIYCFGNGENMRIYIASGDFLTRNTERRVEVGVRAVSYTHLDVYKRQGCRYSVRVSRPVVISTRRTASTMISAADTTANRCV